MGVNGVCGSERWTSCPINHEKTNLIVLPTMESVHSKCGRLAVKCPLVHEVVSGQLKLWQGGPALRSSAQLATVDRRPRQMASNQTALLAFGLD